MHDIHDNTTIPGVWNKLPTCVLKYIQLYSGIFLLFDQIIKIKHLKGHEKIFSYAKIFFDFKDPQEHL